MADDEPNLGARVDKLAVSTQQLATAYEEENRLRDGRIRWSQRAVRWAITVSCFAVVAAVTAIVVAVIATNALAQKKSDDQTVRRNACVQTVASTKAQIAAEEAEERARQSENNATTRRILGILQITPDELARLQHDHLVKYDATVVFAHPLRDCTPTGLADYFAGRGGYLPTTTQP